MVNFGIIAEEDKTWVKKVAIAMSFGGLWWWSLRDEVESLVVDFFGWWVVLYDCGNWHG